MVLRLLAILHFNRDVALVRLVVHAADDHAERASAELLDHFVAVI
jgi:hypothetical protein